MRRLGSVGIRKRSDLVLVLILALLFVECSMSIVRDPVSEFVLAVQTHRVPCWLWPSIDEVERVLERHAEDVRLIESIPGVTRGIRGWPVSPPTYWWAPPACPGKTDVTWMIHHSTGDYTRDVKRRIMSIIGDDTRFHGVPYNILNIGFF